MTVKFYHWKHPNLLLWRTRGGNQWSTFPQSSNRIRLMAVSPGSQPQGTGLGCLHHGVYSHRWWTNEQWVKITTLNPTQHWSCWKPWGIPSPVLGSQEVDLPQLPRDLVLGRLSHLNLLGDLTVQRSQESDTPWPVQGPSSWEADMTQPDRGFYLPDVVMPQPSWGSAHWPGDTQLSGCNTIGRVSFRKTHP